MQGILLTNPRSAVSYALLKRELEDDQEKAALTATALEGRLSDANDKFVLAVAILGLGFIGLIVTVAMTRK